jgi:hypothetical protein
MASIATNYIKYTKEDNDLTRDASPFQFGSQTQAQTQALQIPSQIPTTHTPPTDLSSSQFLPNVTLNDFVSSMSMHPTMSPSTSPSTYSSTDSRSPSPMSLPQNAAALLFGLKVRVDKGTGYMWEWVEY